MKQSAIYFSAAMIGLFQTGLSKADEVFLAQANIGRVTTLLGQVSSAALTPARTVAVPVTAVTAASPASAASGPKQNVSQLSQAGSNNTALINQTGGGNLSLLSQQGHGNVAVINQTSRSH